MLLLSPSFGFPLQLPLLLLRPLPFPFLRRSFPSSLHPFQFHFSPPIVRIFEQRVELPYSFRVPRGERRTNQRSFQEFATGGEVGVVERGLEYSSRGEGYLSRRCRPAARRRRHRFLLLLSSLLLLLLLLLLLQKEGRQRDGDFFLCRQREQKARERGFFSRKERKGKERKGKEKEGD